MPLAADSVWWTSSRLLCDCSTASNNTRRQHCTGHALLGHNSDRPAYTYCRLRFGWLWGSIAYASQGYGNETTIAEQVSHFALATPCWGMAVIGLHVPITLLQCLLAAGREVELC
jgi:hypothetical protein